MTLDDLSVQEIASRALDRCAAAASAWTAHTLTEHAMRIMTEHAVHATPAEIREFVQVATVLAMEDCFSILPPGAATPEHVAHLTSLRVVQAETELRDLIAARIPEREPKHPEVHRFTDPAYAGLSIQLRGRGDPAEKTARDRLRAAVRFKKHRTAIEHDTAHGVAREAKRQLTKSWGEPPRWNENQAAWVERVTRPKIDADPRVLEAEQQHATGAQALHAALEPKPWPSIRVYAHIFGEDGVRKNPGVYVNARPARQVEDATRTARHARAEAKALRTLTPAEAVERIKQARAAEETKRETARILAERERQLGASRQSRTSLSYDGPSLGR